MAAFTLSAAFGNRKTRNKCGQPRPSSGLGNGDTEQGDATQTQGTEQAVGMVEYTTSPVHMMSVSELKMENYFGYTIAIITMLFIAFLIIGYVLTMVVPYCPCAEINKNETEATGGSCNGVYLSQTDENQCQQIAEEMYDDLKDEMTYTGNCVFAFKYFDNDRTDLTIECDGG